MKVLLVLEITNKVKPTVKSNTLGRPKKNAHVFFFITKEEYVVDEKDIRLLNEHGDIEVRRNGRYYSYRKSEIVDTLILKR